MSKVTRSRSEQLRRGRKKRRLFSDPSPPRGFWGFTAQVYDDDAVLLASFGLTPGFKWWAFVVNLAFGVLFRFAQFLVLHYGSALVK